MTAVREPDLALIEAAAGRRAQRSSFRSDARREAAS